MYPLPGTTKPQVSGHMTGKTCERDDRVALEAYVALNRDSPDVADGDYSSLPGVPWRRGYPNETVFATADRKSLASQA